MLPLGLFRRRDFSTANAVAGAMNLGTLGLLFVLMLYLQRLQGRSALQAGLAVIPLFARLSLLAPFAGRLVARIGSRLPMAGGLITAAIGVALLARVGAHSSFAALLPGLLLHARLRRRPARRRARHGRAVPRRHARQPRRDPAVLMAEIVR